MKRKSIRIVLWTVLFLCVLNIGLTGFLFYLAKTERLKGCQEEKLLTYELENISLRFSSPLRSKAILVGSSYVSDLGFCENVYNFGFSGAYPVEVYKIIESRPQSDHILFGLTVHHFTVRTNELRQFPFSSRIRQIAILKALWWPTPYKEASKEYKIARQSASYSRLRDCDIISETGQLRAIYNRHPNLTFVIFPVFPDTIIREKTSIMITTLKNRNLPIIDLSNQLAPEDFTDGIHLSSSGVIKMRLLIAKL